MRDIGRLGFCGVVLVVLTSCVGWAGGDAAVASEEAMDLLKAGNARYVAGQMERPAQSLERRLEVVSGQAPFASVLTCSDSRVPPELIFDRGIGDLFVMRTAGNVFDDVVLGSIEYGAEHLGIRLLVVMGHEKCGAVTAATEGGEAHGHVASVVKAIQPAVDAAKASEGDAVDVAVRLNARFVAEKLKKSSPVLAELVAKQGLKIVAAVYDLDTGAVEFIEP